MAWDRGRYYTRSRKVNGRIVREYVGTGLLGELAARMDAGQRQAREDRRAADRAWRAELDALDGEFDRLNALADLVACAALMVAGYRRHKRGEWRKQRGQGDEPTGSPGLHQ